MTKTARRLIALVAAYAVALHAMLAGLPVLAMAAAPELCASVAPGPIPDSIPAAPDCVGCPVPCGGAVGIAPEIFAVVAPPVASFGIDRRAAPVAPGAAWRRLPPARGPPAA